MKTFIYPISDATMYESTASMNTGIDQILELNHHVDDNNSVSNTRILMKFNLNTISQSISNGTITNPKFNLRLFTVSAWEIPSEYSVEVNAISGSWVRGLGKQKHFPITTEGVSWNFKTGVTDADGWLTGSYANGSTGSYATSVGGGNWYTSSDWYGSQSFDYQTTDLNIDVSSIVNAWLTGSIPNDGFIVKRTDADENNINVKGNFKFFSTETNTIYVPRLEVAWDDSSINTGSLSELTNEDIVIFPKIRKRYKDGSRPKIRVHGRERFPQRSFSTSSNYLDVKYLPTSSYYRIKDAHTEDIMIDFDTDYTKLSIDSSGNYFNLWMDSFQVERFYKIEFKVEFQDGSIEYFDGGYNFKVVR